MIDASISPAVVIAIFASAAVVTIAVLMYRYHIEKLRTPQPKPRYDFEGAITQLQDSLDAGGRAHVRRCDELEDALQAVKRAHDGQLYELEQQVMRLTNERETDKVRFDSALNDAASERTKLASMLSTRVPHNRMG